MRTSEEVYKWIRKEESRTKILAVLRQPLTARQISKKTGIPVAICSYVVNKLVDSGVLVCLNPSAQNSRVFGLSESGIRCRKHCIPDCPEYLSIDVDWPAYGWVCYRHRLTILRMLTDPMQPSEIRRKIRQKLPKARISANNVRDVVKRMLNRGIIKRVFVAKKARPLYELTESGAKMQTLLIKAESPL